MSWRPLLVGDDATRARAIVEDIASVLAARPISVEGIGSRLTHGEPGLGLGFAYLARVLDRPDLAEQAELRLGAALDHAVASPASPYLWSGLAGVVWAVEQALTLLDLRGDDDPHAEVDDVLLAVLDQIDEPPFELLGGVAGLAIYALERMPAPGARRVLERVVALLHARAEPSGPGVRWVTRLAELTPGERIAFPTGYCSFGVAHGNAGVLVVLAAAAAWQVDGAAALAEASARWLLSHRRAASTAGQFPPLLDDPSTHDQPSWCWGDLGIATALVAAGTAVDQAAWADAGVSIASAVAARPIESCHITDANLCHGAVGTAHMLARVGLVSRAIDWYRHAVAMYRPGCGIGGFITEERNHETMAFEPVAIAGMLDGSMGIAMGLAAAISSVEPSWDRAYGMSIRSSSAQAIRISR